MKTYKEKKKTVTLTGEKGLISAIFLQAFRDSEKSRSSVIKEDAFKFLCGRGDSRDILTTYLDILEIDHGYYRNRILKPFLVKIERKQYFKDINI